MGCTSSKNVVTTPPTANDRPQPSLREEQIKLAFKAKRGNVFTQSIAPEVRRTFVAKSFPKTAEQDQIISTSLE
jgi:hypothetical protein